MELLGCSDLDQRCLISKMSSDDDEAVLPKHSERLGTSLARPLATSRPGENGIRRQSRDSQSQLSQGVAGSRQGKQSQPVRKAVVAAPSEDDSDNEASLPRKQTNKLLQAQVIFAYLLVGRLRISNLILLVTCSLQPSPKELRKAKADQLRISQSLIPYPGPIVFLAVVTLSKQQTVTAMSHLPAGACS